MNTINLVSQLGLPELNSVTTNIENIKIYNQQCKDMGERCMSLMVSLRDRSISIEGSRITELSDEIIATVRRVGRKFNEWAMLSKLQSFLQQHEIKDGIDRLHRDLDAAIVKFDINVPMELTRKHRESEAIQERDEIEMRYVLQSIVHTAQDMEALLGMQSSQAVNEIMEALQTELYSQNLLPTQKRIFLDGLWFLHEKMSKLPPLTDLTGQITLLDNHAVIKGTFGDIFIGEWLGKRRVTLRLLRIFASDTDVQKRFQREITTWRTLNHPNVVPVYGIVYIRNSFYSVSPWMANGTAISFVQANPTVDKLKLLNEIAAGLEYLHIKGVIHGDLRGANILISGDGTAGLSDFGLFKFLENCDQGTTCSYHLNPRWLAPELLHQSSLLSTSSDVWSFAIVCLELMAGELPFSQIAEDTSVLHELGQGNIPGRDIIARGLDDGLWSIMRLCWYKEPELRPSMTSVKEMLINIQGSPSPTVSTIEESLSAYSLRNSPVTNPDIQISGPLGDAVNNPKSIINFDRCGSVSSGTLEGLVERLINNFGLKKDLEYRDTFFIGCADFTTPVNLLSVLIRKFTEVEDTVVKRSDKGDIQYNILMILDYWLTAPHLFVDHHLLLQMRKFCIAAASMKNYSTVMYEKMRSLKKLIDDRACLDGQNFVPSLLPGRRIPKTSEMTPHDLAIALTLLEGDKYRDILPTDYIAHLRKQSRPNNVEAAYLTNNKIVLWVKQSVLHYNTIDSRARVLKFFVNAAIECRKFRNFASVTAIANALHSAPIDRLRLTKRELSQPLRRALNELDDLLDPSANHRTYRAALREATEHRYGDACVPWIAVHLHELHLTLQKHPTVVQVDGASLINFECYVKFTDRIKEVLHYVPPDLEHHRQKGQLAYLEQQLQSVQLKPNIDETLMERSLMLEVDEVRDYRTRKRELKRLGFKT